MKVAVTVIKVVVTKGLEKIVKSSYKSMHMEGMFLSSFKVSVTCIMMRSHSTVFRV